MATAAPTVDPEVAELLRRGATRPMDRRRLLSELCTGGFFLAAAVAIGAAFDATRDLDVVTALVLVACFALAERVTFDVGAGYTSALQLAFVPMLLLLPTPWVPLLVAAGALAGTLPDLRGRRMHPDRLLTVPGNCWFAVGPTLVLVLADAQTPAWGDWPWYLLALGAQFAFDLGANVLREWIGQGIAPRLQAQLFGWIQAVDALLSPLGLLAAFASQSWRYAFVLLAPAAGLMLFFSRERSGRLENALALADAAREREELIAAASHELVTPLAVLLGLNDRIAPERPLEEQRRAQVHAAMQRELVQLRQLVRQFVDYTRLKTDRPLELEIVPADVLRSAREVATAYASLADVQVAVPEGLPPASVDPDRLHQMLMGLTANALEAAPGGPVRIEARSRDEAVEVTVADESGAAPEPGERGGLRLYVARELALAQGGDLRVDGPGRVTLVLRRAH